MIARKQLCVRQTLRESEGYVTGMNQRRSINLTGVAKQKSCFLGESESEWSKVLKSTQATVTHPFVVENGDLFSSADNLLTADAPADDELQDCVAVAAPTTF